MRVAQRGGNMRFGDASTVHVEPSQKVSIRTQRGIHAMVGDCKNVWQRRVVQCVS
jgi:hypothetical protein